MRCAIRVATRVMRTFTMTSEAVKQSRRARHPKRVARPAAELWLDPEPLAQEKRRRGIVVGGWGRPCPGNHKRFLGR